MAVTTILKSAYFSYFSKPASDRLIYRTINRHKVRSILECGLGDAGRAVRMIEIARWVSPGETVHYVGVDLFEGRSSADGPGVSLKRAHQILSTTGARFRLVPGPAATILAQMANTLGRFDLVVVSARQNTPSLATAWYYLPRILHPTSEVLLEESLAGGEHKFRSITLSEIADLATAVAERRAA